ncbi:hypothetical protein HQ50_00380 [Porphyromonas sp. COT-052 OH4946]|uniref:Uncharacterized protein n=1 Tax=Porphyromonas gulae TaxID=111105 RepID=A0A0A2FIB7_9PORP|nr:hypothetical protein HQ50_00380 [Porphyromonas sp. COT-052 OH4946]KGN87280.1 hypothetical protein HR08_02460 [Porphyromonas gulae]KGN88074.1 hypothetical protein HQ46_07970 [Porphyromonas gulae]
MRCHFFSFCARKDREIIFVRKDGDVWFAKTWFVKVFLLVRELKKRRAKTKKKTRQNFQKHAPFFEPFTLDFFL